MMSGKQKLYFLLNRIDDARAIAPSGRPIVLHPANDLNNNFTQIELAQLLAKLQTDEKVLQVIKIPNEVLGDEHLDPYADLEDGGYYIQILPAFDNYFLKIQNEPEYQEFAGKRPPVPKPQEEVIKEQKAQLALHPTIFPRSGKQMSNKVNPNDIVNEFSFQNYPFVLMVLEKIASLIEFSADNKVHYQLQSPSGQLLIQERSLLKKFETRGLFRNLGEDDIFGIATLNDIDIEMIRKITTEIKKKQLKKENDKTVKEVVPASSGSDKTQKIKQGEKIEWPEDFKWEGKDFVFGQYGSVSFISNDRKYIFKALTDKRGGWATISEMKGNKDAGYVRSTIKQIEDRLPKEAKRHIKIVSTQDDDSIEKPNTGAYRIKVQP